MYVCRCWKERFFIKMRWQDYFCLVGRRSQLRSRLDPGSCWLPYCAVYLKQILCICSWKNLKIGGINISTCRLFTKFASREFTYFPQSFFFSSSTLSPSSLLIFIFWWRWGFKTLTPTSQDRGFLCSCCSHFDQQNQKSISQLPSSVHWSVNSQFMNIIL